MNPVKKDNLPRFIAHMNQPKISLVYMAVLIFLTFIFFTPNGFALETDKEEIIQLAADSVDIRQKLHKGFYEGHIEFDQGSTHLRSERAETLTNSNNKLIQVTTQGVTKPAHFWTTPKPHQSQIHAYAKTMIYDVIHHQIKLVGQAKIIQGKNSFSAPIILFNVQTEQVITIPSQGQRTQIIFNPKDLPNDPTSGKTSQKSI